MELHEQARAIFKTQHRHSAVVVPCVRFSFSVSDYAVVICVVVRWTF